MVGPVVDDPVLEVLPLSRTQFQYLLADLLRDIHVTAVPLAASKQHRAPYKNGTTHKSYAGGSANGLRPSSASGSQRGVSPATSHAALTNPHPLNSAHIMHDKPPASQLPAAQLNNTHKSDHGGHFVSNENSMASVNAAGDHSGSLPTFGGDTPVPGEEDGHPQRVDGKEFFRQVLVLVLCSVARFHQGRSLCTIVARAHCTSGKGNRAVQVFAPGIASLCSRDSRKGSKSFWMLQSLTEHTVSVLHVVCRLGQGCPTRPLQPSSKTSRISTRASSLVSRLLSVHAAYSGTLTTTCTSPSTLYLPGTCPEHLLLRAAAIRTAAMACACAHHAACQ